MQIEFKAKLYIDTDEYYTQEEFRLFLENLIDSTAIDITDIEIINQK